MDKAPGSEHSPQPLGDSDRPFGSHWTIDPDDDWDAERGIGARRTGAQRIAKQESTPRPGPSRSERPTGARRPRQRSVLGWFVAFLSGGLWLPLQVLTLGLIGAAVFVHFTLPELPDVKKGLSNVQLDQPLRVYSADGALMAEFGVERRQPVTYDQVPPLLIDAFLATEDSRFFEHGGIDVVGMGRALLNYATTGIKSQGASTITMQVTRNFFLSPEKTFQRKIAEVLLALQVEKNLTKQEILELYLNRIFFGHRAYGVAAAAALYYDKDLSQLNVAEMAMLAGLPKAPSANNPVSNPERALERRNYILGRMRDLGYIDETQYQTAVALPDRAKLHGQDIDLDAGYVAEMTRQEILKHFGEQAAQQGLRVTTTIDSRLQKDAQEAVRHALRQYERRHGYRGPEAQVDLTGASEADMDAYLDGVAEVPDLPAGLVTKVGPDKAEVYLGGGKTVSLGVSQMSWAHEFRNANWRGPAPRRVADAVDVGDLIRVQLDKDGRYELSSIPGVTGALVAVSPQDGAVKVLVSGYSFNVNKFNRAVDMRRQPGSSFKPFIYASALNEGWTPASLLKDESISLDMGNGERWTPQDSDGKELGPIPMRKALALSRNLAAINLLQSVGIDDAQRFIRRFGFDDDAMPHGLAMALGAGEVSPVKMAEAYSIFANGGYHVLPYFISRIDGADGQPIYVADPPKACSDCWFHDAEAKGKTGSDSQAKTEPAKTEPLSPLPKAEPSQAEQVIDPRIAYQINSMLRGVVEHGTATRALSLGRPDIVGKTGTTNDVRDSWFCGYQASMVTVAWMGFDAFHKLGRGEEGGHAALGMWNDFMKGALKGVPVAQLDPPPGMVSVKIGGTTEEVMEEYQLMAMGPEGDQLVARSKARSKPKEAKPSAPRVVEDLF